MISNILKTEWLKIKNYRAFWLLLAVTAISYPGINGIAYYAFMDSIDAKTQSGQLVKMLLGNPFAFPQSFHTTAYLSSFFTFIPAIVVIMLITNEYMFKTHRQNIIDGWKKSTFIWGKFISVVLITLIVTLFYLVVASIIGTIATTDVDQTKLFEKAHYILLFSLQVFCQLSIAFLLGLLIRKAFIAYGIFIFYSFILENILSGIFKLKSKKWGIDYGHYLPFEISDRLIPLPPFIGKFNEADNKLAIAAIDSHVVYTLALTAFVWLLSFYIFKKRDL
jgi:ABC-type transport system involved in multi-copper enzyme maturation permease subunit